MSIWQKRVFFNAGHLALGRHRIWLYIKRPKCSDPLTKASLISAVEIFCGAHPLVRLLLTQENDWLEVENSIAHQLYNLWAFGNISCSFSGFEDLFSGFGDSDGYPSERGVIDDSLLLFQYAKKQAGSNYVFVWGHSMGTGLVCFCESAKRLKK